MTEQNSLVVRTAVPDDLDALVPAYVTAFADEAVARWAGLLSPDRMPDTAPLREQQEQAVKAGEVLIAERDGEIVGISTWIEADSGERFRQEAAQIGRLALDRPELGRTAQVLELVAARHPDRPHLFLSSMAVHPDHRGAGIGGALLRHPLEQAAAVGLPVYLEASTPDSQRLYQRYGFRVDGEALVLPDGGPRLQPMWRDA